MEGSKTIYIQWKNNYPITVFMYGPQCEKMWIFGYSGGGGGWMALQYNHTVPVLFSQLSSHLYQSTYKIWKQFDEDILS